MPWRETSPMQERVRFVRDCQSGLYEMSELCERYNISRKTGYKWCSASRRRAPRARVRWAICCSARAWCGRDVLDGFARRIPATCPFGRGRPTSRATATCSRSAS